MFPVRQRRRPCQARLSRLKERYRQPTRLQQRQPKAAPAAPVVQETQAQPEASKPLPLYLLGGLGAAAVLTALGGAVLYFRRKQRPVETSRKPVADNTTKQESRPDTLAERRKHLAQAVAKAKSGDLRGCYGLCSRLASAGRRRPGHDRCCQRGDCRSGKSSLRACCKNRGRASPGLAQHTCKGRSQDRPHAKPRTVAAAVALSGLRWTLAYKAGGGLLRPLTGPLCVFRKLSAWLCHVKTGRYFPGLRTASLVRTATGDNDRGVWKTPGLCRKRMLTS